MKRSLSIALVVGLATFGIVACKPKTGVAAVPSAPAGPHAPAWSLKDPDGRTVNSDQFKGKVVVIDFWATWCPPCRQEIPGYVDLQRKYGKDGLVIIGVSLDQQGPGVVKKFVQTFQVDYPIVMGNDDVVKAFGGIEALPTTFLIDRDGTIRDRKVGRIETSEYERKILSVLKSSDTQI